MLHSLLLLRTLLRLASPAATALRRVRIVRRRHLREKGTVDGRYGSNEGGRKAGFE